jgi:ligand-binding sensor domain-containing protein/two-component sensor histidine kinase
MRSLWFGILAASAGVLHASQLPVKVYTTADGLPSNSISKIVQDSHGFLWFCTDEGLSRFDGYSFLNHRREQGLPSSDVRDLLETRGGQYWIATSRGLVRLHPEASGDRRSQGKASRFEFYRTGTDEDSNNIQTLSQDRDGTIWAGTWNGLYRLKVGGNGFEPVDLGWRRNGWADTMVRAILEDRHGDLWVGGACRFARRRRDGSVEQYTVREGLPRAFPGQFPWINSLLEDREGRLWVGTRAGGLCRLVPGPHPNQSVVARIYATRDGLGLEPAHATGLRVRAILQARDGRLWLATNEGLARQLSAPGVEPERFQTFTTAHGLTELDLISAVQDREGNLWVGSQTTGAMRIARNGFITYDAADGLVLSPDSPGTIFESRAGELLILTKSISHDRSSHDRLSLNHFDGNRFHAIHPNFGCAVRDFGWAQFQIVLQHRDGDWWFVTANGLFRFPNVPTARLAQTEAKAFYTTLDGFGQNVIWPIFEDSRGDVWAAALAVEHPSIGGLSRWSRTTGLFHHYSISEMPDRVLAFAEDRSGGLWMACGRTLTRHREGRFARIASNGSPQGNIDALYGDRAGRIWFGDEFGLTRIDDPGAESPAFVHYGISQGLSGDTVACLTEDQWGRIYIGSGRGVDRLDPATGRIKHYTTADGLVKGLVNVAYRDRRGQLWFGSRSGISQFIPEMDTLPTHAEVRVSGVRFRGIARSISDLGEAAVSGLTLASYQNQVQIDFNGLGFHSDDVRYQYMLEGADPNWNEPTDQRTVNYASLSPGSYRFLVRAVTTDGVAGFAPASVDFRIMPPLWLRWWCLLPEAALAGSAIYGLYRYRLGRLLELEHIRMRIATDLHDDIGASLAQVALLSEVVGQKIQGDRQVRAPLQQIGDISRQLVDSMSDIVWSINPKRDTVGDLTQRMRIFASDVFPARHIALHFRAPDAGEDLKLAIEARRQVFLIFKESANNIIRHAGCSETEIDFRIEGNWLVLRLSDNGKGFACQRAPTGHGLISMAERARNLGGEFLVSSDERGTTVILRIPADGRPSRWRKTFLRN